MLENILSIINRHDLKPLDIAKNIGVNLDGNNYRFSNVINQTSMSKVEMFLEKYKQDLCNNIPEEMKDEYDIHRDEPRIEVLRIEEAQGTQNVAKMEE